MVLLGFFRGFDGFYFRLFASLDFFKDHVIILLMVELYVGNCPWAWYLMFCKLVCFLIWIFFALVELSVDLYNCNANMHYMVLLSHRYGFFRKSFKNDKIHEIVLVSDVT